MSLRPGEVFAGYTVERELGAGGMGSVYLVRHPRLPRFDALKLLRAELCDDPNFVGRFEREADTVAQLDHPNIVAVHDRGSQDGQLWISMRFIDGSNAEKALAEYEHGMPPDRAVRIVSKVASALDYAHRHQLLHRDVKPANILLTAGPEDDEDAERVFLSDFGVAKAIGEAAEQISSLTSTGSVVATLDYASPEQIKGQLLDHRTDIYALGCVLYKLLTGTVPYPGESVAARVYGHLNNVAPPPSSLVPSLPSAFDDVVATAMAKDAADRYPTCRALAMAARAALTTAADGRPPPVREPDPTDGFPTTMTTAPHTGLGTPARPDLRPPPSQGVPSGTRPESVGATGWPGGETGWPVGEAARPVGETGWPVQTPRPGFDQWPAEQMAAEQRPPEQRQHEQRQAELRPVEQHTSGHEPADLRGSGQPGVDQRPREQRPAGRAEDRQPPGRSSPPGGPGNAAGSRRRLTLITAGAAAVVLLAAITAAVLLRGQVAGTATTGNTTASTTATSAPSSSSAPSTSEPVPVPGLPHSAPLAEPVLIGSRNVDGAVDLYQYDTASGAVGQQVTSGAPGVAFPVLSPDRGSMIYVQTSPDGSTLRTAAVDGSGDRELFDAMPDDCSSFYRPAWNPAQQTEIALPCVTAAGNVQVHLLSVDGTEVGTLDTGLPVVDDLTYSPDGGTLAFWGSEAQGGAGTIFTQPADGSAAAKRLVAPVAGASDADPAFSPDGGTIAFRRLQADPAGDTAQLYLVGADGSNPGPLTEGTFVDQDPIFSPDGTQLAFKSNRPNAEGTTDNQYWVINADGSGLKELGVGSPGNADGAPAWGHR